MKFFLVLLFCAFLFVLTCNAQFVDDFDYPAGATLFWLSIGTLIVGAITLYMAYGLFTGKGWAWMIAIILLVIGLGIDLIAWFTGSAPNWIGIILSVVVLVYMLTPRVRESYLQ